MAKFILGRKLNMTQKFQEDGRVVPVTVVEAGPCTVVQVKNKEKDSYTAVQVGYAIKNKKGINKPMAGHLKKLDNFRYLKEFRLDNVENFERSKVFDVTSFVAGDKLKVTATSKGQGFQGVVKRHGFHGSPATHGHKDQHRMPGSIGATDAARVFKGTRMGGRMGTDTITVSNLKLIEVDAENNLLYIKGAVPGHRNSLVTILADGELTFVDPTSHKAPKDKKENTNIEKSTEKEDVSSDLSTETLVKGEALAKDEKVIETKEEDKKVEEKATEVKEEKKLEVKKEVKKEEAKKDKVNGAAREGGLGQEKK